MPNPDRPRITSRKTPAVSARLGYLLPVGVLLVALVVLFAPHHSTSLEPLVETSQAAPEHVDASVLLAQAGEATPTPATDPTDEDVSKVANDDLLATEEAVVAEATEHPVTPTPEPEPTATATSAPAVRSDNQRADKPEIAGVVTTTAGDPIDRGWVTDGKVFAYLDGDGAFVFERGKVSENATLTVYASGYAEQQVPVPADGERLSVAMEERVIRGIYYNPNIADTEEEFNHLIEIARTTEINAIVVDIKEEMIFYDTKVKFFQDTGVVRPILDLEALLARFEEEGIYTIARLVVFKDSVVAERHPHLAVKDEITGDLWRDMNGVAWVNPMLHELWDYNIDLAVEAANLGFDEIQYDYVRFPTDGDLSRVDYGLPNTQENREKAIEGLLERTHQRLIPTGTKLSADIFGYTVMVQDDLGIGQNLDQLAQHVDYLSPMIYPSHWPNGSMAVDGHPNDFPYETIEISMGLAMQQLEGSGKQLRPWLQDFNMPNMLAYGPAEVRAQIDASEDLGLAGWLIWDPNNWYNEEAFLPAESASASSVPTLPVTSIAATSGGYGGSRGRSARP